LSNFIDEWFKESKKKNEEEQELFGKVLQNFKIKAVLEKYQREPEDIKNAYVLLLMGGVGIEKARRIIMNPKHLEKYFEMEREGKSPPEIAYAFIK
jgi:hypothetical protein